MKKYDTLIFDLDGTLTVSKSALDERMAGLLSLVSQTLNLVVITGGMMEQIQKQVLDQLQETSRLENIYILPTSGAVMYMYDISNLSWEIVYENPFTQEQKNRVIESLQQALNQASFTVAQEDIKGEQIEDRGSQITLSALGQKQLPEIKAHWDPDADKRRELISYMSDLENEFDVNFGGGTSIDITLKGIDKEFGINQFYKHTVFKIENGLFIGDQIVKGGNDFAATKTDIDTRTTRDPEETIEIVHAVLEAQN
jgi:phosphomannomutase